MPVDLTVCIAPPSAWILADLCRTQPGQNNTITIERRSALSGPRCTRDTPVALKKNVSSSISEIFGRCFISVLVGHICATKSLPRKPPRLRLAIGVNHAGPGKHVLQPRGERFRPKEQLLIRLLLRILAGVSVGSESCKIYMNLL